MLLGPSGCGKSTALRMIAGLEDPTAGTITIGDRVVNDVEAKDRDIAMVFQSYALYPHMTVRRNIEFPLRSRKVPAGRARPARGRTRPRASTSASCSTASPRSSPAVSASGSRWRGRSCAARRRSSWTSRCRTSTPSCACRRAPSWWSCSGDSSATIVYVTHDQVEAMTMGHRIAVLDARRAAAGRRTAGRLRAAGQPVRRPLHRQPADEHRHRARRPRRRDAGRAAPGWARPARSRSWAHAVAAAGLDEVVIGVRPEDLRFDATRRAVPAHGERGRVARSRAPRRVPPRRPAARDRAPGRARGRARPRRAPRSSSPTPTALHVFDPETGARVGDLTRDRDRRPVADRSRSPARRRVRRRERGLAYLLLIPSLADLRRVRVLAAGAQRVPRLLPQPAVPRPAQHLRRLRPVPRRAHVGDVRRQREDDVPVRVPHRAGRHRARPRPRRARPPAAARHRGLPHLLLVDGGHVGRGGGGHLRHADEPVGRPAAVARAHDQPDHPAEPRLGARSRSRS